MAAPTKESPFPTVVLQHDLPDGTTHFDWLLGTESNGEKPLISFRTKVRPDQVNENGWIDLESRPDHRPDYDVAHDRHCCSCLACARHSGASRIWRTGVCGLPYAWRRAARRHHRAPHHVAIYVLGDTRHRGESASDHTGSQTILYREVGAFGATP